VTLAGLLEGFGCLPTKMNLACFDGGDGVEATLHKRKAKWYNSCRPQYNKTQLLRAQNRKRPVEDQPEPPWKFTRLSSGEASSSSEACFFCGKSATIGKSLCKASTFGIDVRV